MCGRYHLSDETVLQNYYAELKLKYEGNILKALKFGEIFPHTFNVVLDDRNSPVIMKWEYNVFNRQVINTRLESIRDKSFYRGALRCLVPATGFYEWDKDKNKYFIHDDNRLFFMAGIYQQDKDQYNYSIITKPASQTLYIHERAPIILDHNEALKYLDQMNIDELMHNDPAMQIEDPLIRFELF
ncbi:MAG: SOS response-associated peptidase family protein [Erysipelotrichaceae bacterium]|nr:SOS response-associated peptidase family protein [Erysipelotrichaceae bacterium]